MKTYVFEVQEGFEWVVPKDPADFDVFGRFDGSSKAVGWKPITVELVHKDEKGRRLLESDIPWLGKDAPVMRQGAWSALQAELDGYGEFLSLRNYEAELRVFNTTRVVDALDEERSELIRFPDDGRIMKVKRYVFRPEMVAGLYAFKVPQMLPGPMFVSTDVVEAAHKAALRGVGFSVVWES